MKMLPMDPYPEEFVRFQQETQRLRMLQAKHFVYSTHSKRGLLARYLHELANRIDPTVEPRRELRLV
jgi:hypothetical protein